MKKIYALLVAAMFFAGAPLFAQFTGASANAPQTQGFTGPGQYGSVTTVAAALKMWDDSYVTLVGNIVQQIGNEKYLFRDATGTMIVEIDNDIWMGLTVSPEDKIQITGEIDRDMFRPTEVDVKLIKKVN